MTIHGAQQPSQASRAADEQTARALDAPDRALDLRGPFFTTAQAAAYIPCKSVKACYEWLKAHAIDRRSNGSIAKVDLDRELNKRRRRREMHPASLANLRRRA